MRLPPSNGQLGSGRNALLSFLFADHPEVDHPPSDQGSVLEAEQLLSVSVDNLLPVRVADGNLVKPVFGLDHVLVRIIN
jgi:hypothetical protein